MRQGGVGMPAADRHHRALYTALESAGDRETLSFFFSFPLARSPLHQPDDKDTRLNREPQTHIIHLQPPVQAVGSDHILTKLRFICLQRYIYKDLYIE